MSNITISVPANAFSETEIAEILADFLSSLDNVDGLAESISSECEMVGSEDYLKALCEQILAKL